MNITQKAAAGARNNADAMGVGLPVIIVWGCSQFISIDMPMEVAVAIGGVIGSFGAKIKRAE